MKRSLIVILIACSLFTFCSCEKKINTEPGLESRIDSQSFDSEKTSSVDSGKTQSDTQDTEYANAEHVFTKDFDGIIMTITTDKSEYCKGETIHVTASLENTKDEDIYLYYGESPGTKWEWSEEKHTFVDVGYLVNLRVHVEGLIEDTREAYDSADQVVVIIPVHPGEKHVQNYNFFTYTQVRFVYSEEERKDICYPDIDKPAGPGVYDGKFFINVCQKPDSSDYHERYDLDFTVIIK